ncbi:DWNN domain-containing protein [Cladochytrium replicatum]|nr:DWNN domain-containing protein [Cladochytrium replicatum]
MSKVYYKFKSAKTYDSVTFDGTGISVFDLKREVIIAKKLGKGTDFDLSIAHAETEEVPAVAWIQLLLATGYVKDSCVPVGPRTTKSTSLWDSFSCSLSFLSTFL